jgi:hypothetical protein
MVVNTSKIISFFKISNNIILDNIERDKERRLAEERAATAHKLQRKQRLEALVEKRKNNFSYLRVPYILFAYYKYN